MPILDNQTLRAIIMDHYSNPTNKKTPEDMSKYTSIHMKSDNCVDDINVFLKEENGVIVDCLWDGIACTISTSSTDIMCDLVKGKSKDDADKIIQNYLAMIHEEPYDPELLDEAIVFMNTSKQASRIRCATIGWNGLKELIDDECCCHKK